MTHTKSNDSEGSSAHLVRATRVLRRRNLAVYGVERGHFCRNWFAKPSFTPLRPA